MAHSTQGAIYIYRFIITDVIQAMDEQSVEEEYRASSGRLLSFCAHGVGGVPPSWHVDNLSTQKAGDFMELNHTYAHSMINSICM